MNEFLRNFVMKTIMKMIDNNIAEWQVREYALGWYTKGVLTEEDLQEIDNRYKQPEPVEDNTDIYSTDSTSPSFEVEKYADAEEQVENIQESEGQ